MQYCDFQCNFPFPRSISAIFVCCDATNPNCISNCTFPLRPDAEREKAPKKAAHGPWTGKSNIMYAQRIFFEILLNQPEIRLYLPFSD